MTSSKHASSVNAGAWCLAVMTAGAASCAASEPQDFYKGKSVSYVVATGPGGGYDFYGRLISTAMEKQIPGSTFVVRNMPGAGHMIGANFLAGSKPDGLTIGSFNTGLIYNQLVKHPNIRFDLGTMSWIGKAGSDPRVIAIAAASPVKTFADLLAAKSEMKFAAGGVGSANYVETVMLKTAFKLPIAVVTGYFGSADQLAMKRGEVTGSIGSLSSWQQFVGTGEARLIAQIGGSSKDAPQLMSLTHDPHAKSLVALVQSQGEVSRFTVGPTGIPADRLKLLRTAYSAAVDAPEVRDKAAKAGKPLDPATGEAVEKLIKEALQQTPQTIALLKQALAPAAKKEK